MRSSNQLVDADEEEDVALVPAEDDIDHGGCKKPPEVEAAEGAQFYRWSSWTRAVKTTTRRQVGRVGLVIGGLVLLALLLAAATTTTWVVDLGAASTSFLQFGSGAWRQQHSRRPPHRTSSRLVPIPFDCGNGTTTATCPLHYASAPAPAPSAAGKDAPPPPPPECPSYFRHIERDLEPWRVAGITREVVERGRRQAHFRLVVVDGRAYVEKYRRAFQTRDVFTQWGILQLLRRYPGRVPDLDLMFNCEDMPEVRAAAYPDPAAAPPLFRYCKDPSTLDVLFPDWSFWGWPEVNVRPWGPLLAEVAEENARLPWPEREPYAYWKGNPNVAPLRGELLRCNDSQTARLYRQDWGLANRNGFRDSNLARQCRHRYKIYVQGRSWSVSRKYILACDSPVLAVSTPFQDFFSRGLVAGTHYWPIDPASPKLCPAIRFAVDWGNAHPAQAQRIGVDGSSFARDDMAMEYVYDYMLHVLTRYAALLRYKPTVPERAVEMCPESLGCPAGGRNRDFMMQSREEYVADYEPCKLPPPFTADEVSQMAQRDNDALSKIDKMMTTATDDKHN
ncbi:hypothetical protein ABZP36_028087 [Zizania latifolia]